MLLTSIMKPRSVLLILALAALLSSTRWMRGETSTPASTQSPSVSPGTIKDDRLGFAVMAPPGWTIQKFPHSTYATACGPMTDGMTPNLDIESERFAGLLSDYVDANLTSFQQSLNAFKIIKREDFISTTGVKAIKVTTQNIQFKTNLLQIFYFFQGPDQTFVLLTATAPLQSADKFATGFDNSAKTVVFGKGG